eukprot:TRINITY_DN9511_c0_g2_i1.p4 TRINITY_DN9511_c0_g2~~TRINITY_DN9511_c0_g2_i1.p4  ORF type:complete len:135 (-),score=22.05 TRINITY_DN9511_c0_g2_i1:196-600(-)
MLLARGRLVYYGPARDSVQYFAALGYRVPPRTNPADYFLRLMHTDESSPRSAARVERLVAAYQSSPAAERPYVPLDVEPPGSGEGGRYLYHASPIWSQFWGHLRSNRMPFHLPDACENGTIMASICRSWIPATE